MYTNVIDSAPSKKGMRPGINDCKVDYIKLVAVSTDYYKGNALDIGINIDDNVTNYRIFPVNVEKEKKYYDKNPKLDYKTQEVIPFNKVLEKLYRDKSALLKHFFTAFINLEVFDTAVNNYLSNTGGSATFEQFVTFCVSLLPANYNQIPAKVVAGYRKDSKYYEIPKALYVVGNFFTTDLCPDRKLVEPNSDSMKMKPWGSAAMPDVVENDEVVTTNDSNTSDEMPF